MGAPQETCARPTIKSHSMSLSDVVYAAVMLSLAVLLIAPLWVVTYLPLGDLPDHAAQIYAITHPAQYQADYRINWFTPYLVGYSISLFFTLFFNTVTAVKITLSLALVSTPISCAILLKGLKGNRYWVLPSFACAFSYAFFWGFLNYIVATPIAILFFAFCLRYSGGKTSTQLALCSAALSLLLFLAHAMAWAFSISIAFSIIFLNNNLRDSLKRMLPIIAIAPVVTYWAATVGSHQQAPVIAVGNYIGHYGDALQNQIQYVYQQFQMRSEAHEHVPRIKEMLALLTGKPPLGDYVFLGAIFLFWPLFIGAKLQRSWRRWIPLALCFGAFLITPYWLFDTAYVYERFAVFLIPLSFFIYRQPHTAPPADRYELKRIARYGAGVLVTAVCLIWHLNYFRAFESSDQDFKFILSKMEPNKRVLQFMFFEDATPRLAPPYIHFGGWYQAEKGGEALPSFAHDPGAHSVPLRSTLENWPLPSLWNPNEFNWIKHHGATYDYFLVQAKTNRADLFRDSNGRVTLLAKRRDWQLYEMKKPTVKDMLNQNIEAAERHN